MPKKSSTDTLSNYSAAQNFGEAFGWSEAEKWAFFYTLEEQDAEKESTIHKQSVQPVRELTPEEQKALQFQRKLDIIGRLCVAAFALLFIGGVLWTMYG